MNECIGDLRDTICILYLEDVLFYRRTFDENFQNAKTALKCLEEFGVKCREIIFFFKSEVNYLRKIINLEGYGDDPLNIAAI